MLQGGRAIEEIVVPPSYLIADNIKTADAPVRYPFLWNAPKQDQTQWPGFSDNGSDILGLARNLGEVFGVFAVFEPMNQGWYFDFLNNNSANFDGLSTLEGLVKEIGPPKPAMADRQHSRGTGETIFNRSTEQGGCVSCHGIAHGKVRFPLAQTWATPVESVGTDTREYDILDWSVNRECWKGPLFRRDLSVAAERPRLQRSCSIVIGTIAQEAVLGSGASKAPVLVAVPHAQIQNVPGLPLKLNPCRLRCATSKALSICRRRIRKAH